MRARNFVASCKDERDAMFRTYSEVNGKSAVSELLREADLSEAQRATVLAAVNIALTDSFYTLLLGLDGASSIGGDQQRYKLIDQTGFVVSDGNGDLEAIAFEIFQSG